MKVLIVHAKAGAGHKRAAEAVLAAFKRKGQDQEVVLVDCLDYTSFGFKDFYPNVYIFLVQHFPLLWKFIYYSLENRLFYSLIRPLRRLNNYFVGQNFSRFLKKERPRVVISTQFFASEMVAALKKNRKLETTLISVVTDFGAHTFWESEDVDFFIVAGEDTRQDLLERNIPENKIKPLGIPIEPPPEGLNPQQLRQELGLNQQLFTILIVGGGFGVGPIKELVFSLDQLSEATKSKLQLIVVASRNKKLHQEIEEIIPRLSLNVKLFGFVPDLYKMMLASQVIISKSGGLTSSESLASGLPMIIIAPIPGQETKNCDFLVDNGAAIRIDRPAEIKQAVEELIADSEKLALMCRKAKELSRPNAADNIVNLALEYL